MHMSAMPTLWLLLLAVAEATRPFDGTYTVVNKASGHRMFASAKVGLYVVDDSGPIYYDQMWLFAPQENDSFAIINSANGMRVLAQHAADGESGFFAVDHGPIYQDQRWRLSPQSDGSYAIKNVKSGRRISARVGSDGALRFAAIADEGPVQIQESWWLINQERDETARFEEELDLEKTRVARLAEEAALAQNTSMELRQRLQSALDVQQKLASAGESWKNESLKAMSLLKGERSLKEKLIRDVETHQSELRRLQSALTLEQAGKERLLSEVKMHQQETSQERFKLETAKAAQSKLAKDLKASGSELARLALELRTVKASRTKLLATVSSMRTEVSNLSSQLRASRGSNLELSSDLLTVKTSKGKLLDEVLSMRNEVANLSSLLRVASDSNFELASKVAVFEMRPECWMPKVDVNMKTQLLVTILTIALGCAIASCGRHHVGLVSEVRGKAKRITVLEQELQAEFGDMVGVGDSDSGLGSDFGFCVFNTEINQEAVRLIKVQCPGVKHSDVEIELIFNGCEVIIHRQASRGVASATWKRRFQFKPSDGLFEFREEQMLLEDGFLQLIFRACGFQNRRVLFPRHFSLTESDADTCWDFEVEKGDEADAWWNEPDGPDAKVGASPLKPGSLADVDTESTASTAHALV